MLGRLTAATLKAGGQLTVEAPLPWREPVSVRDGWGGAGNPKWQTHTVGQYDVILAQPEANPAVISANADLSLHWLNFYLPEFRS